MRPYILQGAMCLQAQEGIECCISSRITGWCSPSRLFGKQWQLHTWLVCAKRRYCDHGATFKDHKFSIFFVRRAMVPRTSFLIMTSRPRPAAWLAALSVSRITAVDPMC